MRKIDEEDADRLTLAAALLDAGMSPREPARELGFGRLPFDVSKYDDNQPRVPAGNGRSSGRWTSGDAAAGADSEGSALVEGRSASATDEGINRVHDLPTDAIMVKRPDDSTIDDLESPTGKLMAPPRANFREVYAAGKQISDKPPWPQLFAGHAALQQFGTYDFQRDKATNRHFKQCVPAANYAVGVYMAGGGYGKWESVKIAQTYGYFKSSTKDDPEAREWTEKGWDDADQGKWR